MEEMTLCCREVVRGRSEINSTGEAERSVGAVTLSGQEGTWTLHKEEGYGRHKELQIKWVLDMGRSARLSWPPPRTPLAEVRHLPP